MAKKLKAAVFTAKISAVNGTQDATVIVAVPEGNKTWQYVVVSRECKNGTSVLHNHKASSLTLVSDKVIQTIFPNYMWDTENNSVEIDSKDVILEEKIDAALALEGKFESVKLSDTDYSNSGSSLEVYIRNNFTINGEVKDAISASQARKIVFPKDNIDWDLTWKSSVFTDAEKQAMEHPVDLDIAMSNAARDCRKIVEKILTTRYYNKNFCCIGLHGNPGGGKTKMILNDICALNHIPAVAIPCDPMMSITQLLAQVGPVNQKAMVDSKKVAGLINGLKNQLTLLEQNSQRTEKEDTEIREILSVLKNIATVSKECAELVKTPSILMKCLKNNLPLVVFLDEANCSSTQFQNSLAPIISDGIFKDGPEVGHNNGTIKWVLAWNPNTSNTKSFDGKFFDRISFVQVEDVADEQRINYRVRKTLHGMYDAVPDYTDADSLLDAARTEHPESEEDIKEIGDKIHQFNASKEALGWATAKVLDAAFGDANVGFEEGKFVPAYLGDVQLDSPDKAAQAIRLIDELVQKINHELYQETKGRDTKNPDRNSFFYISDRNLDVFTDMIFSYSSVSKAVFRYIFDLIPGGNTVRSGSNSEKSTEDLTSRTIAQAICDKLEGDIIKLHNVLFTEISDADVQKAQTEFKNNVYNPSVWVIPEVVDDSEAGGGADDIDDIDDLLAEDDIDDDIAAEADSWLD